MSVKTHIEAARDRLKSLEFGEAVRAYCPDLATAKDVSPDVIGHRYYDMAKIRSLLPDFAFTPFQKGAATWVEAILRQSRA